MNTSASKSPYFVEPSAAVVAAGAHGAYLRLSGTSQAFGRLYVLCSRGHVVSVSAAACSGCASRAA